MDARALLALLRSFDFAGLSFLYQRYIVIIDAIMDNGVIVVGVRETSLCSLFMGLGVLESNDCTLESSLGFA